MSSPADRDLLECDLALRLGLVSPDQLAEALTAPLAPGAPLSDWLRRRGWLAEDDQDLLRRAADRLLARHGGDARRGLATLSHAPDVAGAGPLTTPLPGELQFGHLRERARGGPESKATPVPGAGPEVRTIFQPPPVTGGAPSGLGAKGAVRYQVIRPHARGGLGLVSVALDRELGREVALKELQARFADHPEGRARFVREAEVTGQLEHPGIIPVYGLGRHEDGRP